MTIACKPISTSSCITEALVEKKSSKSEQLKLLHLSFKFCLKPKSVPKPKNKNILPPISP